MTFFERRQASCLILVKKTHVYRQWLEKQLKTKYEAECASYEISFRQSLKLDDTQNIHKHGGAQYNNIYLIDISGKSNH